MECFEKIGRGEIFIGPPVAPIGHKAILNDEEGRYFILEWSLEQADYQLMLELTRKQSDWTYTKETRENSHFLPAAYNKAYLSGETVMDLMDKLATFVVILTSAVNVEGDFHRR